MDISEFKVFSSFRFDFSEMLWKVSTRIHLSNRW